MIEKIGLVILATLTPVSESRGGIPLGVYLGLNPLLVFLVSLFFNCLIFFPVYFGLKFFYNKLFSKIWVFDWIITSIRKKGENLVKKYGIYGIFLFSFVGAYSASILSWLFNLEWKKAFLAITLGVLILSLLVLGVSLGIIRNLPILR